MLAEKEVPSAWYPPSSQCCEPALHLLLLRWSLWRRLCYPKGRAPPSHRERRVPEGDASSPAQHKLLLRDFSGSLLLHTGLQCTSKPEFGDEGPVLMGNVSFDVQAGLQQAQAELASSGFNYCEAAALQLKAWGFFDRLHCSSSSKEDLSLHLQPAPLPTHRVLAPACLLLLQTTAKSSMPAASQSLSLFAAVQFVIICLSLISAAVQMNK